MNELTDLGWSSERQSQLEEAPPNGLRPARVSAEHRDLFHVITERGEWSARVSGRLRHQALSRADLPVVGDWVMVEERLSEGSATIHQVLARHSVLTRAVAGGSTEPQPLAANLDHVLENVAIVENGPLPEAVVRAVRSLWKEHDDGSWKGQL